MFIFKDTGLRANPFAPHTDVEGTTYPRIPMKLLDEIPDPQPPEDFSDDTYYRTEQDTAPYVVYTRKSDEQIAQVMLAKAKAQRSSAVAAIKVTTTSGKTVDGHEDAQNRMSRAAFAMNDTDVLPWVQADNTIAPMTKTELMEALRLAGIAQAELWVRPYQ